MAFLSFVAFLSSVAFLYLVAFLSSVAFLSLVVFLSLVAFLSLMAFLSLVAFLSTVVFLSLVTFLSSVAFWSLVTFRSLVAFYCSYTFFYMWPCYLYLVIFLSSLVWNNIDPHEICSKIFKKTYGCINVITRCTHIKIRTTIMLYIKTFISDNYVKALWFSDNSTMSC